MCVDPSTINLQEFNHSPKSPTYHLRRNRLPFRRFSRHAFPRRGSACPQRRRIRSRCQRGWRIVRPERMCCFRLLERRESNARSICRWLVTHRRFSSSGPEWLLFVSTYYIYTLCVGDFFLFPFFFDINLCANFFLNRCISFFPLSLQHRRQSQGYIQNT